MELDDIERHIGKQIKMLRMAQKMSQKDLAKKMDITYQQVQKYETGLNRISVSRLWQICNIFSITPNFLFENVLDVSSNLHSPGDLIPNNVATSQDIKLMLAFKTIDDGDKRNLMIKLCEALAS
ncbi:helix-turn-helix domain-containing protein [Hellea sp.]|nr:helix-turn-helix domain-containing protein [Hellea sp.]